uniref:Integrase n=1 Tax=Caenorhabditis japonica TaxID=281687 RepID=A0A8R1I673_CAEJA
MSLSGKKGALTRACNNMKEHLAKAEDKVETWEEIPRDGIQPHFDDISMMFDFLQAKQSTLEKALSNLEIEADKIDKSDTVTISKTDEAINEAIDLLENVGDIVARMSHQLKRATPKEDIKIQEETLDTSIRTFTQVDPNNQFGYEDYRFDHTKLPTFRGNTWEFESFWTQYEELVDKANRSKLVKFNKLLSVLEGEPKELLSRYKVTEDNYNKAVDLLKKKYNDTERIISQLTQQMKNETATSGQTNDQRKLFEKILIITSQLISYGETIDTRMVKEEIVGKFHTRIQTEVFKKKMDNKVPWTLEKILDDIETFIHREEEMNLLMKKDHDNHSKSKRDNLKSDKQKFNKHFKSDKDEACIFCQQKGHFFGSCRNKPNPIERMQILKENSRCRRCTKHGHEIKDCKAGMCPVCGKDHHSSVCFEKHKDAMPPKPANTSKEKYQKKTPSTTIAAVMTQGQDSQEIETLGQAKQSKEMAFIPTIMTEAFNKEKQKWTKMSSMLDSGADQTVITRKMQKSWGLPNYGNVTVGTNVFNTKNELQTFGLSAITIRLQDTERTLDVYVAESLAGHITKAPLSPEDMRYILQNKIDLNEDALIPTVEPDMLIGMDNLCEILTGHIIKLPSGISIWGTKAGFTTGGTNNPKDKLTSIYPVDKKSSSFKENTIMVLQTEPKDPERLQEDEQIKDTVMRLQNEYSGPVKEEQELRDKKTVEFFEETVEKREEGYYVRLPFKENHPPLPDNYSIAYRRLAQLQKQHPNEVLQMIKAVFEEYETKNFIERVDKQEATDNKIHYNALQAVITPSKSTTKCRIVVDASSHYKEKPCLNDIIEQGPSILPDIADMFIRFRTGKTVLISDVEKAFLQVFLHEDDRDVTRILWFKDIEKPVSEDNIVVYRFTRVLFGLNTSPFQLAKVLIHHLFQYRDDPIMAEVPNNIYVDNSIVTTDKNPQEVIEVYKKLKKVFKEANMNLREFRSNCPLVNENIEEVDRSKEEDMKVLGIWWISNKDIIKMKVNFELALKNSRRTVSSDIASKYDPMGFLVPLLLPPKLFQRELWDEIQYGWDTDLAEKHETEYRKKIEDINDFSIEMPRQIFEKTGRNSIITFCDASKEATACCVYVKNELGTHIVFGKAHARPLKEKWTIPKLEMHALRLGTEKTLKVLKALKEGNTPVDQVIIMSDSTIALSWIKSIPTHKEVGTLISNRLKDIVSFVNDIEDMGTPTRFGHVKTEENPADLGTRGCSKDEFATSIWWNGPKFIEKDIKSWSLDHKLFRIEEDNTIHMNPMITADNTSLFDRQSTNSFGKMTRIATHVLKAVKLFSKNLSTKLGSERFLAVKDITTDTGHLNATELKAGEMTLIKDHQKMISPKQLQKYANLGIVKNEDGLLVARGRMELADMDKATKEPILVMPNSTIATQIIQWSHGRFHKPVDHTMDTVRRKFWIPKLRQKVKSYMNHCATCQRFNKQTCQYPNMGRLPGHRVIKSRPFANTGLDNFGPIKIKEADGTDGKAYGTIFTCSVTRLIHVETVKDASAFEFIQAFRRFVAIRGRPDLIVSDNGTNFVLSQKLLEEASKRSDYPEDMQMIKWKFITPLSPWKGGMYERMVKIVKESLYKAVGRSRLTYEDLTTTLYEATASINNRPLTKPEEDINSGQPIRPNDFINAEMKIHLPLERVLEIEEEFIPSSELQTKESMLSTVAALKSSIQATERVWTIWNNKYLAEIREGHRLRMDKKRGSKKLPKEGQLVLMSDDLQPRNVWKMAKVVKINRSSDDTVRDVEILTPSGRILNRSINMIVPLELDYNDLESSDQQEENEQDNPGETQEDTPDEYTPQQRRYNLRNRKTTNYNENELFRNFAFQLNSSLGTTLQCFCLLMLCLITGVSTKSTDPKVYCTSNGIKIEGHFESFEACAENYCTTKSRWEWTTKGNTNIWFPPNLKIHPHHTTTKIDDGQHLKVIEMDCPAVPFCQTIDCTVCLTNIKDKSIRHWTIESFALILRGEPAFILSEQYDITIVHIDGKKNTVADCISRAKDEIAPLPTEELEDIIEFPVCMAIDRLKDRVPKQFTPASTKKPVDLATEQSKDKDIGIIKRFLTTTTTPIDGISEKWTPFLERIQLSNTDNASSFTAAAFQQFCNLLDIGHHRAIPHHSKGNGATERTFRTFHAVMSKYVNKEHTDWDTILPFTTFSYNNTVHSTTGETPFFMVFGRDPTVTIDRIIDPTPSARKTDIGWFKESLTATLRDVWKQAAVHSREAQANYQKKANEGAAGSGIRPGDRVMYRDFSNHKGLSRKLVLPWTGDYRVVEVNPPKATIYDRQNPKKPERIVHLDQIKKIFAAADINDGNPDDNPVEKQQEVPDDAASGKSVTESDFQENEKIDIEEDDLTNLRTTSEIPKKSKINPSTTPVVDPATETIRRYPTRQRRAPAKFND